jgi:hypothetical protein
VTNALNYVREAVGMLEQFHEAIKPSRLAVAVR